MGLKYNCNNLACPHAVTMSLNRSGKIGIYIRNITTQKGKLAQPTYTISTQRRTISLKLLSNGTLIHHLFISEIPTNQTRSGHSRSLETGPGEPSWLACVGLLVTAVTAPPHETFWQACNYLQAQEASAVLTKKE